MSPVKIVNIDVKVDELCHEHEHCHEDECHSHTHCHASGDSHGHQHDHADQASDEAVGCVGVCGDSDREEQG